MAKSVVRILSSCGEESLRNMFLFNLDIKYKPYLKTGIVGEKIRNVFKDNHILLSSNAQISKIKDEPWTLTDKNIYIVIKENWDMLNVYDYKHGTNLSNTISESIMIMVDSTLTHKEYGMFDKIFDGFKRYFEYAMKLELRGFVSIIDPLTNKEDAIKILKKCPWKIRKITSMFTYLVKNAECYLMRGNKENIKVMCSKILKVISLSKHLIECKEVRGGIIEKGNRLLVERECERVYLIGTYCLYKGWEDIAKDVKKRLGEECKLDEVRLRIHNKFNKSKKDGYHRDSNSIKWFFIDRHNEKEFEENLDRFMKIESE